MTIENVNGFVIMTADDGMIFRNKLSGVILTNKIYLGCNDSAENYEEISENILLEQDDVISEQEDIIN